MFDVMHFLMEEDITPATKEQYKAREKFRQAIYPQFYDQPYRLGQEADTQTADLSAGEMTTPVNVPGAPIPIPSSPNAQPAPVARPVPVPVPVSAPPRQNRVVSEGRGMKHKPYIPPTDGALGNDPFHPFQGLRETPMF